MLSKHAVYFQAFPALFESNQPFFNRREEFLSEKYSKYKVLESLLKIILKSLCGKTFIGKQPLWVVSSIGIACQTVLDEENGYQECHQVQKILVK